MSQPDTAADHRTTSNHGLPAEDHRPGVDHAVVLDCGVALEVAEQPALLVLDEAGPAQGHSLVDPYPVADDGRLADDHAGGVVDEEVLSDGRPGVDVAAGDRVGVLGEHPGQERYFEYLQFVGQPEDGHRPQPGVAENDLFQVLGRRVAVVGCLDIARQQAAQFGNLAQDGNGHVRRLNVTLLAVWLRPAALVDQALAHLFLEQSVEPVHAAAQIEGDRGPVHRLGAEVTGHQDRQVEVDDGQQRLLAGNHRVAHVVRGVVGVETADDLLHDPGELVPVGVVFDGVMAPGANGRRGRTSLYRSHDGS